MTRPTGAALGIRRPDDPGTGSGQVVTDGRRAAGAVDDVDERAGCAVRHVGRVDQRVSSPPRWPAARWPPCRRAPGGRWGTRPGRRRQAVDRSGCRDGGIATFSRSMSAWVGPVKFWKPGMSPLGMPVSRIASRSARSAVSAGQVREHARVEHGQQLGQLGLGDVLGELRSPRRATARSTRPCGPSAR